MLLRARQGDVVIHRRRRVKRHGRNEDEKGSKSKRASSHQVRDSQGPPSRSGKESIFGVPKFARELLAHRFGAKMLLFRAHGFRSGFEPGLKHEDAPELEAAVTF